MELSNTLSKYSTSLLWSLAEFGMGTNIQKYFYFLEKSQWWSENRLKEYQNHKIRQLIKHAYENVPFYRDSWVNLGIIPDDIRTKEDLKKLPIVTKSDIKSNFERFKSKDFIKRKSKYTSTGGSTGEPLQFYQDWESWSMGWACAYRGWSHAGYNFGDKMVVFGGSSLIPNEKVPLLNQFKNIFIDRKLAISAFDMSESSFKIHSHKIKEYKPKFIRGYPSALHFFQNM